MKWVLKASHGLVGTWGLAIIMLTILVKLLLFPVTQKTFRSMERMKKIQPLLTEVRDKYQNDRTKMTEETMRLYKEHNVNPFGCLPMFLQFPVYIALYRTIYSSVELYKAEFALWIHDLSQPDPYYILPVLMSVTMFGQQLLMPTTVDNPQMKWMMRIMPLIFGFFMLVLPSGLVLYIFVSSLLGILQQWYIRREQADPKDGGPSETPESKLTRQQRRQRERQQTAS
jgi:YidC/Oxa1 family membrane protein insertase